MPDPTYLPDEQDRGEAEIQQAQAATEQYHIENGNIPMTEARRLKMEESKLEQLDMIQAEEEEGDNNKSVIRRLANAAGRGVTKAIDNTSDFLVNTVGGGAAMKLGVYKALPKAGEENFLRWYQHRDELNPLKFGDKFRKDHLGGPSDTVWEGLAEGGTQFIVGFIGAGKVLGSVNLLRRGGATARAALGGGRSFKDLMVGIRAGNAGVREAAKMSLKEMGYESVRGGIADGTVFGAQEGRLADMMEQYPILRNPIQQMLLTDEDDSEAVGRFKNVVEGMMLGAQIDLFVTGVRMTRAWRGVRAAAKAGDDVGLDVATENLIRHYEEAAEIESAHAMGSQELREVPETDRAAAFRNEDGTAEVQVRLTDTEIAAGAKVADSSEIGKAGLEGRQAAVKHEGRTGVGATHEEARFDLARQILGVTEEADEIYEGAAEKAAQHPLSKTGKEALDEWMDRSPEIDAEKVKQYIAEELTGRQKITRKDVEDVFETMVREIGTGRKPSPNDLRTRLAAVDLDSPEVTKLADELREITGDGDGFIDEAGNFELRGDAEKRLAAAQEGVVTMKFNDPVEAQQVAATLEFIHQAQQQQLQSGARMISDADYEKFVDLTAEIEDAWRAGDADRIREVMYNSDINLKYIHNSIQAKTAIGAISELFIGGEKATFTLTELRKLSHGIFADMTHDEVVQGIARVFGESTTLPQHMLASRAYLVGVGRHARKLAQLVEGTKGQARAIAVDRLAQVLDSMVDIQYLVSGTASNVARALRSQAFPVGAAKLKPGIDNIAKAAQAVDEAKEAVAKAAGMADDSAKEFADKQLEATIDALEKLVRQETDSGLAGAQRNVGLGPEELPRGQAVDEGAEATAEAAPKELTVEERITEARKAADEILDAEYAREGKVREATDITSPLAPSERISVRDMSPKEIDALVRMIHMAGDEPAEILSQILVPSARSAASDVTSFIHDPKLTGFKKAWRAIQYYRVNAMLSGPKTNIINTSSNMLTALSRPIERSLGGMWGRDGAAIKEAADMMAGLFMHYGDAWRVTKKAFSTGTGVLDPKRSHLGHSIGSINQDLGAGKAVNWLNTVVGVPGRVLMAADEFASQVNYRSHLRARLLRQARMRPDLGGDPARIAEWVEDHMRFGYGHDGQAVMKESVEWARENTFKADLGEKGQAFEDFVRKSEIAQVVMPFRKTPLNIANYAWERFPGLNMLHKRFRDDLHGVNGRTAQLDSYGKMTAGMTAYGTAALLAYSGHLRGAGPQNKGQRDLWLAAGNRPYTLTVPGTEVTIDIRRLDPVVTPLSLVADLNDTVDDFNDEGALEASAAIIAAMAKGMSDRTFFTGLSDFLEAVTSGDGRAVQQFAKSFGGSFAPNIVNQMNPDPEFKEARTLIEELQKRVWLFNDDLEPRRNIFGEPTRKPNNLVNRTFNPLTMEIGTEPSEIIARELYEIGASLSMPAPTKRWGTGPEATAVDLRERGRWLNEREGRREDQSPYDRWMELMGSKLIGDRTLRTRLLRKMETESWKEADAAARKKAAVQLINEHRKVAYQRMLKEYPTLRNELIFRDQMNQVKDGTAQDDKAQRVRDKFGLDERGRWQRLRARLNK